ncbi:hypothetical protein ACOSQ2_025867 [Xanthoceras sorbifolium]
MLCFSSWSVQQDFVLFCKGSLFQVQFEELCVVFWRTWFMRNSSVFSNCTSMCSSQNMSGPKTKPIAKSGTTLSCSRTVAQHEDQVARHGAPSCRRTSSKTMSHDMKHSCSTTTYQFEDLVARHEALV